MSVNRARLAVDIGGTFTDVALEASARGACVRRCSELPRPKPRPPSSPARAFFDQRW
jgi:N-methylhydantoinase A/oxoprolinase/acetone carboxylase beta subunit